MQIEIGGYLLTAIIVMGIVTAVCVENIAKIYIFRAKEKKGCKCGKETPDPAEPKRYDEAEGK